MSPITVTGQVYIQSATLTIDPGVTVVMARSAKIYMSSGSSSQLFVNGTAAEPVTITAAVGNQWSGIWIPGSRSTRPKVRISNTMLTNLGGDNLCFDFKNTDFQITDSVIQSVPVVPTGYTWAGSNVSLMSGLHTAIGSFERCLFIGQINGVAQSRSIGVIDCDFQSVRYPLVPLSGQSVNVTSLPY
jgi:hypothetical protein